MRLQVNNKPLKLSLNLDVLKETTILLSSFPETISLSSWELLPPSVGFVDFVCV
jgi:hypothetical protein